MWIRVNEYMFKFVEKTHGMIIAFVSIRMISKGDIVESASVVLEIVHSNDDGAEEITLDDLTPNTQYMISNTHLEEANKILISEYEQRISDLQDVAEQLKKVFEKETE